MAKGQKARLLREWPIEGEGTKSPRQPNGARPGKVVLILALDRVADYYRIR